MQSTSHRQDLGSGSGQDQREGSLKQGEKSHTKEPFPGNPERCKEANP